MFPGRRTHGFRIGEKAEASLFLAVVVCAHVVGLLSLARLHTPIEPRVPIVVDLIALPHPLAQPPVSQPRLERVPQSVPARTNATPRGTGLPGEARRQTQEAAAAAPVGGAHAAAPRPTDAVPPAAEDSLASLVADSPPARAPSREVRPPGSTQSTENAPVQTVSLVPPRFDAPHLHNPRAEYPRLARRMGEQGRVMVRVFVSRVGNAEKVELQSTSGSPRLDRAALEAVGRWKFVPARQGEHDVGAWLLVPVVFRLDD